MNSFQRRTPSAQSEAVPGQVSGVLETIAAGMSMVLSRPYLLVLPILVDLWTWLGVQVRATILIDAMERLLIREGGRNGREAADQLSSAGANIRVNDALAGLTPSIFAGLPHDSVLATLLSVIAPPMTAGIDRSGVYEPWQESLGKVVTPGSEFAVIGLALVFFLGATLLLTLFKVPIAQAVRGGDQRMATFLRDVSLGWLRVLALIGLIGMLLLGVGLPVLIVAQLFTLIGIPLLALVSIALFIFGSLGGVALFFLSDAMFIYRVGPIRAARMSYAVARIDFAQSWRFAAALLLIATGLLQVWSVIVENPPGVIVALILNAALGTGLSIASMMFFHDRARLPRQVSVAHVPRQASPVASQARGRKGD